MKRLFIMLVLAMSLFIKPLFVPEENQKTKMADVLKDVYAKQKEIFEEKQRRAQEEAVKKAQEEEAARKQKELQKKIDELKAQEEKKQQEEAAARKKEAESLMTKEQLIEEAETLHKKLESGPVVFNLKPQDLETILDAINKLPEADRAKPFEKWFLIFERMPKLLDRFKENYIEALKKTTDKDDLLRGLMLLDRNLQIQKTALKNPLELLEEVSFVIHNHAQATDRSKYEEYKDIYTALMASIVTSLTFDKRFDELFVDSAQADRLAHVLVLNEDLMMPIEGEKSIDAYTLSERLFFATIVFGQHLVDRLSTISKNNQAPMAEAVVKMLLSFPVQKYSDKAREWLKSVVLHVDFSTIPGKLFARDLLFFFKAINDPEKMDQAIQKYVKSVGELNSLEALRQAKDFLTQYFSKEFSKNSSAKRSFLKQYSELVKTSGVLSDYRSLIESSKDSITLIELSELQFALLGKLEDHPDWLKKSTAAEQEFLGNMMKEMTDKRLPKSATALFNLIKTVKSVIDDRSVSEEQRNLLKTFNGRLADDIVPSLDWTQRWSGKISSFFDTYLPWWGKNKTYKPHWISWPQEQRLMIYGIIPDDWSSRSPINEPTEKKFIWIPMFDMNKNVGQKALDRFLEIRDWYQPKAQYAEVHKTLENDARDIFEHIFVIHKIFDYIKDDVKKQELFFSFKKVPSLGTGDSRTPLVRIENTLYRLTDLFENAINDGTLSFDRVADDVVLGMARNFDVHRGISAKLSSMTDHQFDELFIPELTKAYSTSDYSFDVVIAALSTVYNTLSNPRKKLFSKAAIQYLNNAAKTLGKDRARKAVNSFIAQARIAQA